MSCGCSIDHCQAMKGIEAKATVDKAEWYRKGVADTLASPELAALVEAARKFLQDPNLGNNFDLRSALAALEAKSP